MPIGTCDGHERNFPRGKRQVFPSSSVHDASAIQPIRPAYQRSTFPPLKPMSALEQARRCRLAYDRYVLRTALSIHARPLPEYLFGGFARSVPRHEPREHHLPSAPNPSTDLAHPTLRSRSSASARHTTRYDLSTRGIRSTPPAAVARSTAPPTAYSAGPFGPFTSLIPFMVRRYCFRRFDVQLHRGCGRRTQKIHMFGVSSACQAGITCDYGRCFVPARHAAAWSVYKSVDKRG